MVVFYRVINETMNINKALCDCVNIVGVLDQQFISSNFFVKKRKKKINFPS